MNVFIKIALGVLVVLNVHDMEAGIGALMFTAATTPLLVYTASRFTEEYAKKQFKCWENESSNPVISAYQKEQRIEMMQRAQNIKNAAHKVAYYSGKAIHVQAALIATGGAMILATI